MLSCGVAAFIPGAGGCRSLPFRAAGDEDRYDRGLVSSCVRRGGLLPPLVS